MSQAIFLITAVLQGRHSIQAVTSFSCGCIVDLCSRNSVKIPAWKQCGGTVKGAHWLLVSDILSIVSVTKAQLPDFVSACHYDQIVYPGYLGLPKFQIGLARNE